MKLTTKHKVYGVVVVLGLGAIGVDRVFVLPSGAAAQRPSSASFAVVRSTSEGAAEVPPQASPLSTGRAAIAERLDQLAEQGGYDLERVPSAFARPTGWPEATQPVGKGAGLTNAAAFEQRHTLNAVMAAAGGGYAIINGRTLFIGQELDGFELILVSDRSAVFEANGTRAELVLPDQ